MRRGVRCGLHLLRGVKTWVPAYTTFMVAYPPLALGLLGAMCTLLCGFLPAAAGILPRQPRVLLGLAATGTAGACSCSNISFELAQPGTASAGLFRCAAHGGTRRPANHGASDCSRARVGSSLTARAHTVHYEQL